MKNYDIAIIGAGSGGLSAAYTAKGFSKKVVLMDMNKPGGECTWSGCIPSKALINIAKNVFASRKFQNIQVDTSNVLNEVRNVIQNVYEEESPKKLKEDGIDYIKGFTKFIDKNTLDINGARVRARRIIISTGSSPFIPSIDGIDKISYLTNENIFYLEKLPQKMIILGGGAIGVELAQSLNRLGVRIHLVEMMEGILFREEHEMAKLLEQCLIKEGVNIHTLTKAISVKEKNNKILLEVDSDGERSILESDSILIASGRKPNIEGINLEKVGIEFDKKGIKVDKYMKTSVKEIYAIGDVVGPYQFSHMANIQAITAVQNAVLPINKKVDYDNVAWCTFSDPEFARAGLLEKQAREKYGDNIRVYTHDYENLDRAKTKLDSIGLVKVICDKKGNVIGASILGDRAGELISEIQVVKTLGISFDKLSKVIHPYPTYSEVLNKMSKKVYVDNVLNNPFIKIINKIKLLKK